MRQRVSDHSVRMPLARVPQRDTIRMGLTRLEEDDMKRIVGVVAVAALLTAAVAVAQQPPTQPGPERGHQHMHGSMCPMMGMMGGGMMGGSGMMGMMGGQADARTMQLRGEMMKAMGDIMIKYGKAMEGAGR
jgi:hypothetical protein